MLNLQPQYGFTPLDHPLSIRITSDVPVIFGMSIFLKNSSLSNSVQNAFRGVSSIRFMIMTIKTSYNDVLRVITSFFENSNSSTDLKKHPGITKIDLLTPGRLVSYLIVIIMILENPPEHDWVNLSFSEKSTCRTSGVYLS